MNGDVLAWITGGTMVQATHLAAALRLGEGQWRFVTDAPQLPVRPTGSLYVLPGANERVAASFIGVSALTGIPLHMLT
jgi:hypothetical protein